MVGLLILRSHSVTFLILTSGFRNRFLLAPYYLPGGKLVKFFFSGSPPLELARGFLPASRDSFNGKRDQPLQKALSCLVLPPSSRVTGQWTTA